MLELEGERIVYQGKVKRAKENKKRVSSAEYITGMAEACFG